MKIELEAKPSYGMAVVTLDSGESITAESGAMVAMSPNVKVDTTFNGTGSGMLDWLQAMLVGLVRKFLAGETLFVNTYKGTSGGQRVMLAPAMVGDIERVTLDGGHPFTVQSSSYLASTKNVAMDLIWGGFSMLFSKEGAFFLRCKGEGEVLVNSYGAIEKIEIDGSYRVDTGHVVGFQGDLQYKIRRVGGWKSTLLSGEGLILEFTGTGTLWMQTRNMGATVGWITPHLPR
jgi:uncharacterized protein (TIGR00266 family)